VSLFPASSAHGVVEDSPNLTQLKGMHLAEELTKALVARGITAPVHIANDADAIAAGVAATRGQLNKLTRVWTLGNGIGYGRWPYVEGVWEGGHVTVSLDPKEKYCGCGGVGHLEGIMGYRAMRMRFLDLEPEEVFAHAKEGDQRCREFVDLWHRALAAATASFIHLAGPGRFYFTGHNAHFLDLPVLRAHLESMVKMSTLQKLLAGSASSRRRNRPAGRGRVGGSRLHPPPYRPRCDGSAFGIRNRSLGQ
jgi:glucokinase